MRGRAGVRDAEAAVYRMRSKVLGPGSGFRIHKPINLKTNQAVSLQSYTCIRVIS